MASVSVDITARPNAAVVDEEEIAFIFPAKADNELDACPAQYSFRRRGVVAKFLTGSFNDTLLAHRFLAELITFYSIEKLRFHYRNFEFIVKLLRLNVILIGCPFHATAIILECDIAKTLHEQLAHTLTPYRLSNVQLFEVQRSRKPDCRPQERIRRESDCFPFIPCQESVGGRRVTKDRLVDLRNT
jgi:hypothetical protein